MAIENPREIRGLGPSFPQLPQCPKYPKTCETWLLDGHYTWVKPYLMWNDKFKTWDYFL